MLAYLPWFLGVVVLPFFLTVIIYVLIRGCLPRLLNEIIGIPAATTFYVRILAIGLFFISLAAVLDANIGYKEGQALMEYVWTAASKLSTMLSQTCLFLALYLVLVTILVAALRRRNDQ